MNELNTVGLSEAQLEQVVAGGGPESDPGDPSSPPGGHPQPGSKVIDMTGFAERLRFVAFRDAIKEYETVGGFTDLLKLFLRNR